MLPAQQFQEWGWRLPFILSAVLVAVGFFVRMKVVESPLFKKFDAEAERRRIPVLEVFAKHSKSLLLGTMAALSQLTISGIASAWAVNAAVAHGAPTTGVLNMKTVAAFVMLITTVISARLCDRVGRRPVLMGGIIAAILFAYPLVLLVQNGTLAGFAVGVIVGQGIQGVILGPLASFLAEMFPTSVRFTGASVCFQVASAAGGGFTPIIAAALVAAGGSILFGAVWIAALVLCLAAVLFAREGKGKSLEEVC
jgi:MFS family permease